MTEKLRFLDNEDGTVTDTKTGLMWTKTDTMNDFKKWVNYQESADYVRGLREKKFAGYDNWRLPTRDEMVMLYDKTLSNKDTFGKEVHISNQFASGCGLSMIAQILPGRMWTFVLNLRDGEMSNPHRPDGLNDGLWSLTESARAVRDVAPSS
ncbi:MAG: DUF1566 domain-containing protein [Nitrospinota bacterium]|nr:DUF1566 domain-containing protein [Nitrospinota bacterium]